MGELAGLDMGGSDDGAGDVLRVCGEGIGRCGWGDGVSAGRHDEENVDGKVGIYV